MFNIGPPELIIILVLALIIFGPKRLPEMGKTVGKSLREFRQASSDIRRELREGLNEPAPGTPATNGEGSGDGGDMGPTSMTTLALPTRPNCQRRAGYWPRRPSIRSRKRSA